MNLIEELGPELAATKLMEEQGYLVLTSNEEYQDGEILSVYIGTTNEVADIVNSRVKVLGKTDLVDYDRQCIRSHGYTSPNLLRYLYRVRAE